MTPKATKKMAGILILAVFLTASFVSQAGSLYAAPKSKESAQAAEAGAIVNINKATAQELETIRGIGPSIAERIIKYREEKGPFKQPQDLVSVRGVGGAKFEKIKSQITV
mgnify:CR=1 FL=1